MKLNKSLLSIALGALSLASTNTLATETKFSEQFSSQPMFMFGVGLGGDEVGSLKYTNGDSTNVTAGGGIFVGAGMVISHNEKPFGIQLSGAYKFDSAVAENADVTFDRFEFTAMPYFRVNEQTQLGVGISRHAGVEFSMEMDGEGSSAIEFEPAMALVAQLTFSQSDIIDWGVRFTSVEYEANGYEPVSGSNASIFFNYRLD